MNNKNIKIGINKILILTILTLTLSSCFNSNTQINNEEEKQETTIEKTQTGELNNSGSLINETENSFSGSELDTKIDIIKNNSGTLTEEKDIEIIEDKKVLEEIVEDKKIIKTQTGEIKTEDLLDDISEDYEKEIEEEILKLFE